jgi:hypothetical protein
MLFPVSMKPPVATPGAGKAYSIEKGTLTLYIKSKTRSGTDERVAYLNPARIK